MSELWYDAGEDVLGIQLTDKRYWKSLEVSENVVVDLSHDGEIVGIEIFRARQSFKKDSPLIVSKAITRAKRKGLPVN